MAAVMTFPAGLFPMSIVSFSQTRFPSSWYRILCGQSTSLIVSASVVDPGSGALLNPGSGILDSRLVKNQDLDPG